MSGLRLQCSVADCGRDVRARGWCTAHYCRWSKTGDVQADVPVAGRDLLADLTARIDAQGDCWVWMGGVDGYGYGRYSNRGAHRLVWETLVGPIATGLQLDHLCRNTLCVNPAHLEPVTLVENLRRGHGFGVVEAGKTHCPAGHPYAGGNVAIRNGGRTCRQCERDRARRRYAQEREVGKWPD